MLTRLRKEDTVVVSRLSNALRGIRELGVFLDLCREYGVRIVSIHDDIDSKGELFPTTGVSDVLDTIARLSSEATALRRSEQGLRSRKDLAKPRAKQKMEMKMLIMPFCAYSVQIRTTSWLLLMSAFLGALGSSLMLSLINSTARLAPVVTACIEAPVNQKMTHPPRMKPRME